MISMAQAGSYEDFFQAVANDDASTIRALLQRGFDPNARDPQGQTGLYLALRSNASQAADTLLKAPSIDVDALNEAGETALMMASLKGHTEWVRRLLDRGAKVDKAGWTALHYAATGPEPAVVKLLLERRAVIDARSPNRSTPLMMAAQYGSEASVELLLSQGADPRAKNDLGLGVADFARLAKRDELAAKLDRLAR
ncbi:MAG TPA: ankyrin repeat domain-containing protein [Albitalea sp.]|nr:ankyrin repeat domain-containing protein [Albitalea sp.]